MDNEFGRGNDLARAIVFLTDPEQPFTINTDLLRSIYGLTAAEMRATLRLTEGDTIEEIASDLGICITTLKTQLRQVYIKTGASSRAKFVRLLFSLSQA